MKDSVVKRLEDLERKQGEPVKFRLLWYDEDRDPPEPGTTRIQLRWYDELEEIEK
jgi:hypothetical protein